MPALAVSADSRCNKIPLLGLPAGGLFDFATRVKIPRGTDERLRPYANARHQAVTILADHAITKVRKRSSA